MGWVFWEIVIPLIIAFLIGLLFGWLFWRWRRTKIEYSEWETMRQKASRSSSGVSAGADAELTSLRKELASVGAERDGLRSELDGHVCEVPDSDGGPGVLGLAGAAAAGAVATGASMSGGDSDAEAELVSLRGQLASSEGANDDLKSKLATAEGDAKAAQDAANAAKQKTGAAQKATADATAAADAAREAADAARKEAAGATTAADTARKEAETAAKAARKEAADATTAAKAARKEAADATAEASLRSVVGDQRFPYGSGSHAPFADNKRDMPEGYPIKGNIDSMLYHRQDSRNYGATGAEVWFDTPETAEASGFGLSPTHPSVEPPKSGGSGAGDGRAVVGGNPQPYGSGSHAPFADNKRDMPEGYPIKGNIDSMLYHRQDSRNYGATGAEVWFDTPETAEASGFGLSPTHPDSGGSASAREVVGGDANPYGAGSHAPFADNKRDQPKGYPIKGNIDSMLYHRQDSRNYGATIAEVWFDTPETAEASGFGLSPTHPNP